MLQSQVQTSETLLQDLQKSFSQSQNAVQSRLVSDVIFKSESVFMCLHRCSDFNVCAQAEFSFSQRKMCNELSRLKGEDVEDELLDSGSSFPATLQVLSLVHWFSFNVYSYCS